MKFVKIAVVVFLLAIFAATNPTTDDLVSHIKTSIKVDKGNVFQWLEAEVGGLIAQGNVERTNLGFFSFYRVNWPSGKNSAYLGLCGVFLELPNDRLKEAPEAN